LALLPLIIFAAFGEFLKNILANYFIDLPLNLLFLFFYSLWLLYLWAFFSISVLDFYLDVWFVTNRRLIDIEQKGLFNREISEFPLDKIQDITVKVTGLIETLLNFGDLDVKTASENVEIIFHKIPNPEKAKNIIWEQHNKLIVTGTNSNS